MISEKTNLGRRDAAVDFKLGTQIAIFSYSHNSHLPHDKDLFIRGKKEFMSTGWLPRRALEGRFHGPIAALVYAEVIAGVVLFKCNLFR